MTGILFLDAAYLLVAITALALTRAEARAREAVDPRSRSVLWGLLGALACALWPVTVLVMGVTILVTARRAARADEDKAQTALA